MQIGIAAKKVGLSVDAIRFYERNALLRRAPRTEGGFRQYGRCERPERFAELYLQIHHRLHSWAAGIAQDRATSQRAGAEFHSSMEPSDHLFFGEQSDCPFEQLRRLEPLIHGPDFIEVVLNLAIGDARSQIAPLHEVGAVRSAGAIQVLVPCGERGAHCAAGIAGRRLDPQALEGALATAGRWRRN